MGILVKGGTVVTALDSARADVYCDNGTVTAVGIDLSSMKRKGDREIDASGKLVLPGAIDAHTHMELPFMGEVSKDDFEQGTIAGTAGGTTTIIDFVIPTKGQSLLEGLAKWKEKAQKAVSDYAFHMAVVDWSDKIKAEIPVVAKEHGITSFKMFMAYKGAIGIDDEQLFNIMLSVRDAGGIVTGHCVNGDVLVVLAKKFLAEGKGGPIWHVRAQPPEAEGEACHRAISLATIAGVPLYIVHNSCDSSVEQLKLARAKGLHVYGETCTQYFLLDESLCEPDPAGVNYILSPPLRTKPDQESLWAALRDGYIQTVATDHCPFDTKQKLLGKGNFTKIPNGLGGVEERLALMYSYGVKKGRITAQKWVDCCCTAPARIFGLYPRKGAIAPGGDADLVIFDPSVEWSISAKTHLSRSDHSPFEGWRVQGKVETSIVRGRVLYEKGKFQGSKGDGQFLRRPRFERV
ncbi:dihydropyrimidinase [bacterium]|nr:dihydropyrimidinase [bacterium]